MMSPPGFAAPVTTPKVMEGPGGKGVHLYTRTESDPALLQRLLDVSALPPVASPVVALPDLHWKDRLETPSSTAVGIDSHIIPTLTSSSQNCGMSLLTTPFSGEDLTDRFVDGLMASLRCTIPRRRRDPALEWGEVLRYCRLGAPAVAERFQVDPAECRRIESGGNTLHGEEFDDEDAARLMDRRCISAGRYSFAVVGGGNHFLELQVVTDVIDPEACDSMGIVRGGVVVMFHTGSERLGHDLGRLYARRSKTTPRSRRKLFWRKMALHMMRNVAGPSDLRRRWAWYLRSRGDVAIPADSPEGRRLILSLGLAANFGYANRLAVAGLIQEAFRRETGSRDLTVGMVADLSHNMISRERVGDKALWVHRHNAVCAPGPGALPEDHPYGSIGQPAMIPGTNRTSSYLVVGRDSTGSSLYSVDHGAGQTVARLLRTGALATVPDRLTRKYTYRSVNPEVMSHLADDGIDEVITTISMSGLAAPAARLRPVAVLKA